MNRLDLIVSFLKDGYNTLLDIGTDHGYTILKAFQKGYIKDAIASDLRLNPLLEAKKNLKNFPVEYVQSDGFLNILDKDFDVVVISGMGSYLISEIMNKRPNKDITYILQSNDKIDILRKFISNHNLFIINEDVVFDKFYYVVLKVVEGFSFLTDEDIFLGPILKNNKKAYNYYVHQLKVIKDIYHKSQDDNYLIKIKWLENTLSRLKVD